MKTLPVVPKASIDRGELLNCSELPLFYMNDYSKIGLQVSPYEEALAVLRRNHYMVSDNLSWANLTLRKIDEIPAVVRLLSDHGIESQMTDVVTTIYQG
jgi:hypothetical protein